MAELATSLPGLDHVSVLLPASLSTSDDAGLSSLQHITFVKPTSLRDLSSSIDRPDPLLHYTRP